MLWLLWLVPILPYAGFLLLWLFGRGLSRRGVDAIGVGSVGLSALFAILVAASFIGSSPVGSPLPGQSYTQLLWNWMRVDGFQPQVAFYLDALSLIMMLVVSFVGLLILVYSTQFMEGEEGYSRFFAYMDLFLGSMLTLVLADNLLLLFLGWEGVGLCSYLLIGFWYRDPVNGRAARKAFVVTRVGDTAFIVGLFLLFNSLGSLRIQELMGLAARQWPVGSGLAVAAAALLLGGALGKSAQLPLQTWLPDAMAGPTPVSALIHAATMVTAGVYLIARTNVIFSLAPVVQSVVAIIGAFTLLYAGFSALTQNDLKRVLAYSTISQIGYMFLALGVGAWSAAIFHFMTHAFFKALLFMSAGAVILFLRHEQNIFRMGGLRRQMPLAFWTFLIGSCSMAAVPLVTAGFYSKDLILFDAWSSSSGSPWLWIAGVVGTLLTSLYIFRAFLLVFYGETRQQPTGRPDMRMALPMVVLAFLSIVGGFIEIPGTLGNQLHLSRFLSSALPPIDLAKGAESFEAVSQIVASLVSLAGICLAYLLFRRSPNLVASLSAAPCASTLGRFWQLGWGFDWLYHNLLVRPVVWAANVNRADFVDLPFQGLAWLGRVSWATLSQTENGRVRFYAMGIAAGAVIAVAIGVFT